MTTPNTPNPSPSQLRQLEQQRERELRGLLDIATGYGDLIPTLFNVEDEIRKLLKQPSATGETEAQLQGEQERDFASKIRILEAAQTEARAGAFFDLMGQIGAMLRRSEKYAQEARDNEEEDQAGIHARVSCVLAELQRLGRAFSEQRLLPLENPEPKDQSAVKGQMKLEGLVNERACPWLEFGGKAGSEDYAEATAEWLSQTFAPERYVATQNEYGWWYAERDLSSHAQRRN